LTALRLGTRGSRLALAQARAVAEAIGGETAIVEITTAGDVDRARGDKSRWTGALEAALLAGDIDLAVHSAKDVPGELAGGTAIAAAPRRADPFDVLVGEDELAGVREGARVGTSALRRKAQLLAARPDLQVRELRGNVDTRLRKLAAGEADVIVLAAAGLARLDRMHEAGGRLDGELFVPAAGQGVILIQGRAGSPAADAAAAITHAATMACLQAERAAIRALGASCHAPVGVSARLDAGTLQIRGFAGLPDGSEWVLDEHAAAVAGPDGAPDAARAEAAGEELAGRMRLAGAHDVLRRAEELAT
jgi:hydroxymethylbilane synthase